MSKRAPRMAGSTRRGVRHPPPQASLSPDVERASEPAAGTVSPMPFEPPWSDLVQPLQAAAQRQGQDIDVHRTIGRLQAAVRTFHCRRVGPQPLPVRIRRRRLAKLATGLKTVLGALYSLQAEETSSPVLEEESAIG